MAAVAGPGQDAGELADRLVSIADRIAGLIARNGSASQALLRRLARITDEASAIAAEVDETATADEDKVKTDRLGLNLYRGESLDDGGGDWGVYAHCDRETAEKYLEHAKGMSMSGLETAHVYGSGMNGTMIATQDRDSMVLLGDIFDELGVEFEYNVSPEG